MIQTGQNAEAQDIISSNYMYAADAGGSDAYAISLPQAPTSYTDGLTVRFKANTANTGASTLNVNTLGAINVKKWGGQSLQTGDIQAGDIVEVVYFSSAFWLIGARILPAFQQLITSEAQPMIAPVSSPYAFGSNNDGSVLYSWNRIAGSGTWKLTRFLRDDNTGLYYRTHEVTTTLAKGTIGDNAQIVVIGSSVYVCANDNTNIIISRFVAADLTSETVMTVPTVACSGNLAAWTNGTDIYLVSDSSSTTSRRWTVSGTTFTAASTATVTSPFTGTKITGSFYDGTNAFLVGNSGGAAVIDIIKYTAIDGSAQSSSSFKAPILSDSQDSSIIVNIDAKRMYIGICTVVYDETGGISVHYVLIPVTKP